MDMNKQVHRLFDFLSRHALVISLVWLTGVFVIFYPTKIIAIDEFHYIGNAYFLSEEVLRQPCDEFYPGQFRNSDFCISKYNLGTSLLFLPAVNIHYSLIFVTTFVAFIAAVFIFRRCLQLLKLSPVFLYLFSLFPAFIYFTRTAFSETFTMTFLLGVVWALLEFGKNKQNRWWMVGAGVMGGIVVLTRYTAVIPLAILIIGMTMNIYRDQVSKLIQMLILVGVGALPFALVFLAINSYLYGGALKSGYSFSGEEVFVFTNFLPMFVKYFLAVNVIYPGMLLAGFWSQVKLRFTFLAAVLAVIVLYSLSPNTLFTDSVLDLISGIRFLIPVLPLAILTYAGWLDKFVSRKWFSYLAIGVIACLMLGALALSFVHQKFITSTQTPWPSLPGYFSRRE